MLYSCESIISQTDDFKNIDKLNDIDEIDYKIKSIDKNINALREYFVKQIEQDLKDKYQLYINSYNNNEIEINLFAYYMWLDFYGEHISESFFLNINWFNDFKIKNENDVCFVTQEIKNNRNSLSPSKYCLMQYDLNIIKSFVDSPDNIKSLVITSIDDIIKYKDLALLYAIIKDEKDIIELYKKDFNENNFIKLAFSEHISNNLGIVLNNVYEYKKKYDLDKLSKVLDFYYKLNGQVLFDNCIVDIQKNCVDYMKNELQILINKIKFDNDLIEKPSVKKNKI